MCSNQRFIFPTGLEITINRMSITSLDVPKHSASFILSGDHIIFAKLSPFYLTISNLGW